MHFYGSSKIFLFMSIANRNICKNSYLWNRLFVAFHFQQNWSSFEVDLWLLISLWLRFVQFSMEIFRPPYIFHVWMQFRGHDWLQVMLGRRKNQYRTNHDCPVQKLLPTSASSWSNRILSDSIQEELFFRELCKHDVL